VQVLKEKQQVVGAMLLLLLLLLGVYVSALSSSRVRRVLMLLEWTAHSLNT
jgi:hypothetical protein